MKHTFPTPPESLCFKDPYVAIARYRGSRQWATLSPALIFRNDTDKLKFSGLKRSAFEVIMWP